VTLRLSTREDEGDHALHVVEVTPAAEESGLERQRIELTVKQDGSVVGVNAGATKAVFGFNPAVRSA